MKKVKVSIALLKTPQSHALENAHHNITYDTSNSNCFRVLQEQYDYLHRAVLHALTFDCRSIAGDMFLQNYNKLIEKNGGKRIIDKQFQVLHFGTYMFEQNNHKLFDQKKHTKANQISIYILAIICNNAGVNFLH